MVVVNETWLGGEVDREFSVRTGWTALPAVSEHKKVKFIPNFSEFFLKGDFTFEPAGKNSIGLMRSIDLRPADILEHASS